MVYQRQVQLNTMAILDAFQGVRKFVKVPQLTPHA